MKNLLLFAFLSLFMTSLSAQDDMVQAEQLGDNFSLEGALELFKSSKDLEDFEQKLNSENNEVNNLDVNEDDETDYIRVEDVVEDNVHVIMLQAVLGDDDAANVAVIELEKTGDESAVLQIVGDEDFYGDESIVEPFEVEGSSDGKGPDAPYKLDRIIVNVWFWPSVRYVYAPGYRVYVSPFRWRVYPRWYRPYRPRAFHVFHPLRIKHRSHYHVVSTRRVVKAKRISAPKRKTSVTVKRKKTTVVKTKNGRTVKKTTTTKKTTVNKKGKTGVKKTTKTKKTKVKKKNGKAGMKKTTKTKKVRKKKGGK